MKLTSVSSQSQRSKEGEVQRGQASLIKHSLTGFWSRPAMYKLFQLRRSSIKTLVLMMPYLISWKRKEMGMKNSKIPHGCLCKYKT